MPEYKFIIGILGQSAGGARGSSPHDLAALAAICAPPAGEPDLEICQGGDTLGRADELAARA